MEPTENLDPRSVANEIIEYARRRNIDVTNLAIQKLLYFAHAKYLVEHGGPLVRGAFEAWEHGPVNRPVYDALKPFGREPIRSFITARAPFEREARPVPRPNSIAVQDHIKSTVHALRNLSAFQLVELSHAKGGAWDIVWNKSKTEATFGNRISDKLTVERFGKLKVPLDASSPSKEIHDEASPPAGD